MYNNKNRNNKENPKSLNDLLELSIYRTSVGMEGKDGISFYGISRFGIKCYLDICPRFHKWTLPKSIIDKIVDLHIPENREKIETHIIITNNPVNKELLDETLFFGERPNNNSNRKKLSRHSNSSVTDRKLANILRTIFPDHLGSYTQVGPGLSHSEIIIWDLDLNKKLHDMNLYNHEEIIIGQKRRHVNNNNTQVDPFGSPESSSAPPRTPGTPRTPRTPSIQGSSPRTPNQYGSSGKRSKFNISSPTTPQTGGKRRKTKKTKKKKNKKTRKQK